MSDYWSPYLYNTAGGRRLVSDDGRFLATEKNDGMWEIYDRVDRMFGYFGSLEEAEESCRRILSGKIKDFAA